MGEQVEASGGPTMPDRDRPQPAENYSRQFRQRFERIEADTGPAEEQPTPEPEETAEPAEPQRSPWRSVVRSVMIIAFVVLAALVLRTFVIGHYYIPSESMEPTLHGCKGCDDDHVLVDKVSYRAHPPRAGDIVVFNRPPADPSGEDELIKRVIGVPGETITLRDGHVYVNRQRLAEPYVNKQCGPNPTRPLTAVSQWRIPTGSVFVLGDNRCDSLDSRAFGPIKDSSIVGRAFAIIWPLRRARLL